MIWVKRFFCGFCALSLIFFGIQLLNSTTIFVQILGFILFVFGATLGYISVMQTLPRYNFWVTLIAIALAYILISQKLFSEVSIPSSSVSVDNTQSSSARTETTEKKRESRKIIKKAKKTNNALSSYPKLTGSAEVIDAHVFYIQGRYVRLFGLDAPDSDQLCSDSLGSAYNCGMKAASWMRSWIDDNVIDCYILKVEPRGKDLAVCMWGEYDLGAGLVGAGWAIANTQESSIYIPYQENAKKESYGLWQGTFYKPEDWRNMKRNQNNVKFSGRSSGGFFSSWF